VSLHSCAEFVKHLVQSNKEQELALEKTKQDLEAKRRKIEDDTEYQQDPSEPESTTSSLTTSSNGGLELECDIKQVKKPRLSLQVNEDDCIDQLDEIARDSKGSSSEGGSSTVRSSVLNSVGYEEASNSPSSQTHGGVSSVGAVAHGLCNHTSRINHRDVVVKGRKKRLLNAEATSMDASFNLDYEEVFIMSNVPQLLATTAGRIIAWNDIFLTASGLLTSDIDGLTIFSLVRQTELAKLFEIVATALRSGTPATDQVDEEQSNNAPSNNYTAITLPCATFRPRHCTNNKGDKVALDNLLYMTVTLMADDDPKKRCFHCFFTDCAGTNGALGSVTPDLLSSLFTHQITK
jgi:hypothetical protein